MSEDEYRALESVFLAREDALCKNKSPLECDLPLLPLQEAVRHAVRGGVDGGALK